ncbi:hypothetical protein BH23BAC2_BH23BAC2_18970 [soil metagenome]
MIFSDLKDLFCLSQASWIYFMLSLLYAAGLRAGELINLKVKDIDGERKMIYVWKAKGLKDRVTMLSDKLLVLLRTYYKEYKPNVYFFEGQYGGPYTCSSLRAILRDACQCKAP